jgi:hypothetical protein
MSAQITVDASSLFALTAKVLRQIPFAANNAIRRTATEARDAGRAEVQSHFTLRKTFIARRVKIMKYSTPQDLTAVIGIDNRVQGAPILLPFFESGFGGDKRPIHGSGLAVPITGSPARPNFSDPVARSFRYTNLALASGKGKKRTFIIPGIGVFERTGPGKRDITIVYAFERTIPLRPRMTFRERIVEVIRLRFPTIFYEEMHKELTIASLPSWKA